MPKVSDSRITKVLHHLVKHGWVSLRSMSSILGYSHPTGIYGRQRGKKRIPTVQIGGTQRVYVDTFIETLQNVPECDQIAAQTILKVYYAALKLKEKLDE